MKLILQLIFFPLAFFRLFLIILISIFFLVAVSIEYSFFLSRGKYQFWSSRNWGKSMLFINGFRVKKNKRPNVDKFIIMPVHRSYIDVFLLAAYSPSVFVAKAEIKKWPILGQAIKATKAILVQRNEMKSLLGTMQKIRQSIESGFSITIFPEGTTSKGPGLLPFKNGTFKVAADIQVPIVPCAICYQHSEHAWISDETFIGHFFRELWRPVSMVEIRFGEVITGSDFLLLKQNVKEAIEKMLSDMEINPVSTI